MTLFAGLIVSAVCATFALPAYAAVDPAAVTPMTVSEYVEAEAQTYRVPSTVIGVPLTRETYDATSPEELAETAAQVRAAEEAVAAAAASVAAAELAGETARTRLDGQKASNGEDAPFYPVPPNPAGQARILAAALPYQGIPYVFGGASPSAGFDCSGLIKYVYAKFGVNLPHHSDNQGAMGVKIPYSDAVPGDLIVSPGHIGIYAGNGMMLHAPRRGAVVHVGPIYAKNFYVSRIAF